MSRECDGCTRCCEGWLMTQVNLRPMYPGNPCPLVEVGVGCTDHANRPIRPCRTFFCGWILNEDIPDEYKPDVCGVIITTAFHKGSKVLSLIPAPNNPSQEMIDWFKSYADDNGYGLIYYEGNNPYTYGNTPVTI